MRVLLVSSKYPPEYSGSGHRAHNTYKRLSEKYDIGFNVLTSSVESNGFKRYLWDGVRVVRISVKTGINFNICGNDSRIKGVVKRLLSIVIFCIDYCCEAIITFFYLIRQHKQFDLIHVVGTANVTSVAITYAKITRKPIIVEFVNLSDNPHQFEPYPFRLLLGKGLPKNAIIVCISDYLKCACLNIGYDKKQIWCRPNPVDEQRFNCGFEGQGIKCEEIKQGNNKEIKILQLGKFVSKKNQIFMLEVMDYLPSNYKLLMVGPLVKSGPLHKRDMQYYSSIIDTIKERKLEKQILLETKFVQNPQDYIRMADVLVMPSLTEACGTPMLEALACGVPVVTSDIPGVFDSWIVDGENGFVCELNHKEWADRIVKVHQIDKDKMKMASKRILEVASTATIDKQYYDHMKVLVNKDLH